MALSDADAKIKNAKSQDKTYRLYDERGLYLEVSPKGGKWWRFKYRPIDDEPANHALPKRSIFYCISPSADSTNFTFP